MDLYYFYNGMNNIINLSMNHKDYIVNSNQIHNDPLILLNLESSFNLKGGDGTPTPPTPPTPPKTPVAKPDDAKPKDKPTTEELLAELKEVQIKIKEQHVKSADAEQTRYETKKTLETEFRDAKMKRLKRQAEEAANADEQQKLKLEAEALEAEATAVEEAKTKEEEEAQKEIEKELQKLEEEEQKRAQKESLSSRGVNALKLLIKIVVFLAFITLLPIAPFIAISYYSFKKLKEYYDNQIVTL